MGHRFTLILELTTLFVLVPLLLVLDIPFHWKILAVLIGILYVSAIVYRQKLISWRSLYQAPNINYWKQVLIRFALLIIGTVTFMWLVHPEQLFIVLIKNPLLWIFITLFYSTLSVFPQEFLYRSFFFTRYQELLKHNWLLILVNATLFSLGHIAFKNGLVLALTFVGGIVFAITYHKTRSLVFTSLEHAMYGSWLFTVGMGEMLAFPMPE